VKCVWRDGHITWETKSFLDSLQGHTSDVLYRASNIARIEFFISNPVLSDNVIIVDTPGTNAAVEDDVHEERTAEFFQIYQELRNRHEKDTVELTARADAVIYLTGGTVQSKDNDFIDRFQRIAATGSNVIAVIARADLVRRLMTNDKTRDEYLKSEGERLNNQLRRPVVLTAVSSQLQRISEILRSSNFSSIQYELKEGFSSDWLENAISGQEEDFFSSDLPTTIPVTRRQEIIGTFTGCSWNVIKIALHSIYFNDSLDEAISELKRKAGFQQILHLLQTHFFSRGRMLRCVTVANATLKFVDEIIRESIPKIREDAALLKRELETVFLPYIMQHQDYNSEDDNSAGRKLQRYLIENFSMPVDLDACVEDLLSIKDELEQLVVSLNLENDKLEVMMILHDRAEEFSANERSELEKIMSTGDIMNDALSASRERYWRAAMSVAASRERAKVCEIAARLYMESMKGVKV